MLKIYGVPFSAHTRKVIITAQLKGLDYAIEPVVPLAPPDGWEKLSPAGKIPAIKDNDFVLSDSSVICAYLDRKYPQNPVYPTAVEDFAQAFWFEEYVDNNLQQFILHHFLFEAIFSPAFLKTETNWELVNKALTVDIPQRFQALEQWVKPDRFLVADQLSIADITLTSILINFSYGGKCVDENRFPKLAAYFNFMLRQTIIQETLSAENSAAKTVPGFHFEFLQAVI